MLTLNCKFDPNTNQTVGQIHSVIKNGGFEVNVPFTVQVDPVNYTIQFGEHYYKDGARRGNVDVFISNYKIIGTSRNQSNAIVDE